MHVCYIDESGTPDVPGNTSHFVLAGVSVPVYHWRDADREIRNILTRYALENEELHTAWLLRSYQEQSRVENFDQLPRPARKAAVLRERNANLLQLQQSRRNKQFQQTRKNYRHTEGYIHLTRAERTQAVQEVADCIGNWGFCRLFAECVDKLHFDPARTPRSLGEQAFEQVVSRFDRFLANTGINGQNQNFGMLVHDNNQTVAKKHTALMQEFHRNGTLWGRVRHIIETPLFVDSSLTRMVQVADLCSYALRRYVENSEDDLFLRIWPRADRIHQTTVGVRHYTEQNCTCMICQEHQKPQA